MATKTWVMAISLVSLISGSALESSQAAVNLGKAIYSRNIRQAAMITFNQSPWGDQSERGSGRDALPS